MTAPPPFPESNSAVVGGYSYVRIPAPASIVHFLLFLFSFAIGYLINWILAALLWNGVHVMPNTLSRKMRL